MNNATIQVMEERIDGLEGRLTELEELLIQLSQQTAFRDTQILYGMALQKLMVTEVVFPKIGISKEDEEHILEEVEDGLQKTLKENM